MVLLEGEKSAAFRVEQGVAQVSVFIYCLLWDVEEAGLGIEISNDKRIGGMLFVDDIVGVSESRESLQELIVVCRYCNRWRLKANVGKRCSKDRVESRW